MLEAGVDGGNGAMYEVQPSVVVFISGGFGLAPPHYWRLRVTQAGIEPLKVEGDPPAFFSARALYKMPVYGSRIEP